MKKFILPLAIFFLTSFLVIFGIIATSFIKMPLAPRPQPAPKITSIAPGPPGKNEAPLAAADIKKAVWDAISLHRDNGFFGAEGLKNAKIVLERNPAGNYDFILRSITNVDIVRFPNSLKDITPVEQAYVQKLRQILLDNEAIAPIASLAVPILLPNNLNLPEEMGAANTIASASTVFILLRPEFFAGMQNATPPRLQLRTLYHELCHAYLGSKYGLAMQDKANADEDFAWFMENLLGSYIAYRQGQKEEPQRREREREIDRRKFAQLEGDYPGYKEFWEKDWKFPGGVGLTSGSNKNPPESRR
jgi:hypothetical protein